MIKLYLWLNVLVAYVVFIDGIILKRQNGKIRRNKILYFTTMVEFLWAIISVFILFFGNFPDEFLFLPQVFVAYNVFGWFVGFVLLHKSGTIVDVSEFKVSQWLVDFCILFGVVYFLAGSYILINYDHCYSFF